MRRKRQYAVESRERAGEGPASRGIYGGEPSKAPAYGIQRSSPNRHHRECAEAQGPVLRRGTPPPLTVMAQLQGYRIRGSPWVPAGPGAILSCAMRQSKRSVLAPALLSTRIIGTGGATLAERRCEPALWAQCRDCEVAGGTVGLCV